MKRKSWHITFFFGLWSILLSSPWVYILVKSNTDFLLYPMMITLFVGATGMLIGIWVGRIYTCSYRDQLTGVYNRRYLDLVVKKELSRLSRRSNCLSVAIIDIDYFKKINDKYGHEKGDSILVKFTKLLIDNSRKTDHIIRLGGDEFLVILPGINNNESEKYAERIRTCICGSEDFCELSICVGVATTTNELKYRMLLKEADKALYKAKISRNRVVCTMVQ